MLMNKAMGKRGLTLLTALMAVVLVVSGCGGSGLRLQEGELGFDRGPVYAGSGKAGLAAGQKEETTELTWYVNADWWNTDFGKDVVTKKIKEDLNINIKFITGDDTKLNTFLPAGICRI